MNEAPEKPTVNATVIIDRGLWDRLRKIAQRNHRSTSAEARVAIERAVLEAEKDQA